MSKSFGAVPGLIAFWALALLAPRAIAQEQELAPIVSPPPALATPSAAATSTPSASPAMQSAASPTPASAAPVPLTDVTFKGLKARAIGPAVMGGRVSDIAIDPRNPAVFYVGLGTGGIFKSSNNGVTFDPIFDKQPLLSIGAVAVAPSDSDVVWVGTGEANDRNSSEWGNGVYRSTDGGSTWSNVGLPESRAIARIVVHPTKPEVAYVAAMGNLWKDGGERGLYKTIDGGKTWKQVLRAPSPNDVRTGCGDVALNPANPEIVYAALYARQRTPWSFAYGVTANNGNDVGGIFKSSDGGATWKKCGGGLPGQTGRIGLAVSSSKPNVVMAIVQSDEGGASDIRDLHSRRGGVFRSEDGGEKWTRMSDINPRSFYFSQIRIDPANDQRVYVLGIALLVSDDGGKNFREDLSEKVHPDCHALAIQAGSALPPKAPKPEDKNQPPKAPVNQRLLLGTDGGVYQSYAAGKVWEHLDRFPAGQYYRISVDDRQPFYRIAGGLQDNESFVGPSQVQSKEGLRNCDWTALEGGDGFYVVFDPSDPDIFYAESQEGYVHRINLRTGEKRDLRPEAPEGQERYRFHWNAPLIGSKHQPGVLYLAGNHIFRLTEKAEHFEVISPDLTRREPDKIATAGSGAENYGVVYSLAESPVKAGLLWAGTDDGRLWVTQDGGKSWTELTEKLPQPERGQWIVRIEPGAKDAKVAYVVTNAYRSGDDRPFILRTADMGQTWQSVVGRGLGANNPVEVIREDPVNSSLLYAGTHFGLFASLDGGGHWQRIGDLPNVRTDDLKIHPRTADLVIGTHGRSLAIIDDTRPFRELTPEVMAKPAHLFSIPPARGFYLLSGFADWNGKGTYRGENPPEGALLSFWVKEFTGEEVKIAITNSAGQPIANLKAPGAPGLGRVNWDLRPTKDVLIKYGGDDPEKFVPGGDYTAELSYGKEKMKQTFHVEIAEGIITR
ncbi:MAG: glycosyl hydrolase [Spartobacteria bacterium]